MTYTVDSYVELPHCEDICRLCLQDDETLWNIFETADGNGLNLRLAEKILACLDIMVVIGDGLPDLICGKCMTVIRSFFEFRKQCQDNDSSLRKCFLDSDKEHLQRGRKAICNSPQPCPRRSNDSHKQSDQAELLSTEEPNDSLSFSLRHGETPEVLNAGCVPLLKQLEDDWSDEDPSDLNRALEKDTVKESESPWRLGYLSPEVNNSNSAGIPLSMIGGNQNLDSNEAHIPEKSITDPFMKTAEQQKEIEALKSKRVDGTLIDNRFTNKSVLLTTNEDNRSEQTCHIEDSKTSAANDDSCELSTTATTEEMIAGRVSRSKLGKWVCSTCNKNYTTLRALKKHISVHYSGCSKCSECPATFDNEEALNIHKAKHSSSSLYLGHSCQHCFKSYRLKHLLEQHVATEHGLSQNLVTVPKNFHEKCGKCGKVFYYSTEMETHDESCGDGSICSEEESSDAVSAEPTSGLKGCYLCRLNFENVPQLTYHFKKVHNEDPTFKCETCEKLFSTFSQLSDHRSKVHKVKHTCENCPKSFREKTKLRRHINSVHKKDRPFQCNLCDNLFKTSEALRSHHNTHTKTFQCGKCNKNFRSKNQLNLHENVVHLGIKDHMCEHCGETFVNQTRLKYHLTRSTSLNLQCEVCGKIFCVNQKLQRHLKFHNSTKFHNCEKCALKFLSKKGLCAHLKLEHKIS